MHLIQIVPRLAPDINGLGDYALNLARQILFNFGIKTQFIVGDHSWVGGTSIDGFDISRIDTRSETSLLSTLTKTSDVSAVLLHYVGYGYARRGCPSWLVHGLAQWRLERARASLITMFHETYASGAPWTSAFWLSPLQKKLVSNLAQISDRCFTNTDSSAAVLGKLSRGKHSQVTALAVFSNVGEEKNPQSLFDRPRKMVVFGTKGRRLQVYQRSQEILTRVCNHLEIDEIFDIGHSLDLDYSHVTKIPVTTLGELPAEGVSQILSNSVAGFVDYPERLLCKSGIFASYCAHGVLPIIATNGATQQSDELVPGKHYWLSHFNLDDLTSVKSQLIATSAFEWYQTHDLSRHAAVFASALGHRQTLVA